MFERMWRFANKHGNAEGRPYFSADGIKPLAGKEWLGYRAGFAAAFMKNTVPLSRR